MTGYTGPTAEEFDALFWTLAWLAIGISLAAGGYLFAAHKERRGSYAEINVNVEIMLPDELKGLAEP